MDHFHSLQNGCNIERYYQGKNGVVYLKYVKCLTHNKNICRCGYEWGWHGEQETNKIWEKGTQDLTRGYPAVYNKNKINIYFKKNGRRKNRKNRRSRRVSRS